MLKQIIFTFIAIFLLQVLYAQTKTFNGTIDNVIGKGVPGMTITVNTPTGESTVTDENGDYHLTTNNFPTSVNDVKMNMGKLEIFPNPTNNNATVKVPSLEGTLEAYSLQGQLLDKATLPNDLDLFINANIAIVRYTNKENNMISTKKVVTDGSAALTVEEDVFLKGATIDTFNYKLRIQGEINDNEIDLTVNSNGFYKDQTTHTENYTIDTKQTFLNIINIALGKILTPPYSLDSAGYLDKRRESATIHIYNADNTFNETISTNELGEKALELPVKGTYFAAIREDDNFFSRIARIICDENVNNKITTKISKEMSERNYRETEQAYQINWDDIHGELLPPRPSSKSPPMTQGWQGSLLKKGGLKHVILKDFVMNAETGTYHEEETPQILIDSVLSIRAEVDPYLNNFYANGNTVIVTSGNDIPSGRKTLFSYYDNDKYSTGFFAKFVEDGVITGARIALNKDYWGDGTNNTRHAALQEHLSVKAPYELQHADKPNILEAGGSENYITNDTKRALETYQIERELLRKQAALTNNPDLEASGVYPVGIEELALKESANHPLTQEIVMNNGVQNIIDTLNTYTTKSATLKSEPILQGKYAEFTTHNIDGSSNTVYLTKDNFAEAKLVGISRKEIKDFFEK